MYLDLDIVVCVKNRAVLLNKILTQIVKEVPFKNLIVIYGSSVDNTVEVAKKYTKNVFWDEDKGLGSARNLGIQKAKSQLVAMIDTDIILTDGWFKKLSKHFYSDRVAAAMGSTVYGYGYPPIQGYYEYFRNYAKMDCGCTNIIFRREIILKIGNFDCSIIGAGEDYELYKRVLANGYEWVWDRSVSVNHPLTFFELLEHHRWYGKSTSVLKDLGKERRYHSLVRIYSRLTLELLDSIKEGVIVSLKVHPLLLFMVPMMNIVRIASRFRALKMAAF